ncbi:MAG: hypothetical protein HZT43_21410 [Exiguobacterium profundum]|nr:MAG: hypothetical protein HZT43_21410 [Exiguobacterium profundum]
MVLARQRPHDTMLLLAPEGSREWNLHGHVKEVMDWCGLPPDRLCLVDRPMQCDRLRTVPLPEEISDSIPTPGYLALLEENAARLSLRPAAERASMSPALACWPGRAAFTPRRLSDRPASTAGLRHPSPESVSLRRQMEVYAGAETLVFAEGSALHGRQLIGWRDQTIAVINRRGGSRMARSALQARSRATLHVDAVRVIAVPTSPEGREMVETGLCFLIPCACRRLATAGIDLSRDWDPSARCGRAAGYCRLAAHSCRSARVRRPGFHTRTDALQFGCRLWWRPVGKTTGQTMTTRTGKRTGAMMVITLVLAGCTAQQATDAVLRQTAQTVVTPVLDDFMTPAQAVTATDCVMVAATSADLRLLSRDVGVIAWHLDGEHGAVHRRAPGGARLHGAVGPARSAYAVVLTPGWLPQEPANLPAFLHLRQHFAKPGMAVSDRVCYAKGKPGGRPHGPVHASQEFQDPHRQDLAPSGRRQERAQVPDLPLEPR